MNVYYLERDIQKAWSFLSFSSLRRNSFLYLLTTLSFNFQSRATSTPLRPTCRQRSSMSTARKSPLSFSSSLFVFPVSSSIRTQKSDSEI